MRTLVDLAIAVSEGEKAENVSPLVKSAMEQYRAEREAQAATEIVELVRTIEGRKVETRKEIRQLKEKMRKLTSALDDLDRRWEFAQATNNFIPVLAFFQMASAHDLPNPDDFARLSMVPDGWKKGKK
jgi:hypothetical protein